MVLEATEIHLAARPDGVPTGDQFATVRVPVRDLHDGEVLVRNTLLSVDPYMRGRMNPHRSYIPPFEVDAPLEGAAIGEVVASRAAALPVGTQVVHARGWRDLAVGPAGEFRPVDTVDVQPSSYLGVLGMPGQTAYAGLIDVAGLRPGETVFVSGAAGAVGSLVGQLARLSGASRVIGSAGTPEKVRYLREELGFDAAFCYRDGPVRDLLKDAAPDGIDVAFDNVGGDHLEAAITRMRPFGRIALCGAIATYNEQDGAPGPRNLVLAIGKRLRLQGFVVTDAADGRGRLDQVAPGNRRIERALLPFVRRGELRLRETIHEGIAATIDAFLGLWRGENTGKMLVRLPVDARAGS